MDIIQITAEKPSIKPNILFEFLGIPITSSILMALLITAIILIFSYFIYKKSSVSPAKWQIICESIYEFCYDLIDKISGSSVITKKIFYLIASLFIFIGLSNLLGIFIPFLGSFTYKEMPIFRSPTTDFNVTFSLAASMVILIQLSSIKKKGIFGYLGEFIKIREIFKGFKEGLNSGLMGIISFFIGLLDIVSEFAKVISLSMRLFGNMFAGEMLAVILLGFLAYGLPSIWMSMNIFAGFVQAIVFGSLTTAYYSLAVKGGEAEEN